MHRRSFLQLLSAIYSSTIVPALGESAAQPYAPGRIPNEYSLFLPGEREALDQAPHAPAFHTLKPGMLVDGWTLVAIASMNGSETAVFERNVAYQGALVYRTEAEGIILRIPKGVGHLENIRPRPIDAPRVRFTRQVPYVPGPDLLAEYILQSNEDPCYENVAALGPEYIGYTLAANEEAGPLRSLFLDAAGRSRQLSSELGAQGLWAPDTVRAEFDPAQFFPGEDPSIYRYLPGYSKRTLLGGYLPVAHIGVWNPDSHAGYEVMVLLPPGVEAQPVARIRITSGGEYVEHYWNTSAAGFFSALAGVANRWQHFFEDQMQVDIPGPWLLNAARAGIVLSRCSYRGLEPTYQIGEGAYTKIPERSHALFPVAHYEFVWAHQLWNLTAQVEPYVQHYLDRYILPDGNFLYNTQDQVEAPLNAGVFLWNSARAYDYTQDFASLDKRLPVLRRMISFVLERYSYSKTHFPPTDRRYGLIWGSPEADLGDPQNDFPNSHPYYFQNAAWTWRGLTEHARCLKKAGETHGRAEFAEEAARYAAIAVEMRGLIERSLDATIAASTAAIRAAGIAPFTTDDIRRDPKHLTSYENHRFMMDWFSADWGNPSLDLGHLKHREIAGQQILGLHTDGDVSRTSNFMDHGSLAVKIRQDDCRPFLLNLYALCCYTADSGNRYSPEDAYLPGSFPGDGNAYFWSAVVNSVLQPALGLRWLLCYEESNRDVCHLQKAAPKHWFAAGRRIRVEKCPTRFGVLSWNTLAVSGREWRIQLNVPTVFDADLNIHVHPPDNRPLATTTAGNVNGSLVVLEKSSLAGRQTFEVVVHT